MSKFDADNIKDKDMLIDTTKLLAIRAGVGVIKSPVYNLDCIYIDKIIPDACDLYGSANCGKCTNYVKK